MGLGMLQRDDCLNFLTKPGYQNGKTGFSGLILLKNGCPIQEI